MFNQFGKFTMVQSAIFPSYVKLFIIALGLFVINSPYTVIANETSKASVRSADTSSYNPQLSVKEAALVNWELAKGGMQAVEMISSQLLASIDSENITDYSKFKKRALRSFSTILKRYNSNFWIFEVEDELKPIKPIYLFELEKAIRQECYDDVCSSAIENVRNALSNLNSETGSLVKQLDFLIASKEVLYEDDEIMEEILVSMSNYLVKSIADTGFESGWSEIDGFIFRHRVIGAMAFWRNMEPFIAMRSPQLEDEINMELSLLLETLRNTTSGQYGESVIAAGSNELIEITKKAAALGLQLEKASKLFVS